MNSLSSNVEADNDLLRQELIAERNGELRRIESRSIALGESFRDVAEMVAEQGRKLDQADAAIEEAASSTAAGSGSLKEAEKGGKFWTGVVATSMGLFIVASIGLSALRSGLK